MRLLAICLGGAIGSGARYLVSGWALSAFGAVFPWGTLVVNLAGSFLLTMLVQLGASSEALSPTLRIALATGVLGGFTTYSTFNYETIEYLRNGNLLFASANLAATVLGCLAAGLLGLAAGRWLSGF